MLEVVEPRAEARTPHFFAVLPIYFGLNPAAEEVRGVLDELGLDRSRLEQTRSINEKYSPARVADCDALLKFLAHAASE